MSVMRGLARKPLMAPAFMVLVVGPAVSLSVAGQSIWIAHASLVRELQLVLVPPSTCGWLACHVTSNLAIVVQGRSPTLTLDAAPRQSSPLHGPAGQCACALRCAALALPRRSRMDGMWRVRGGSVHWRRTSGSFSSCFVVHDRWQLGVGAGARCVLQWLLSVCCGETHRCVVAEVVPTWPRRASLPLNGG